VDPFINAEKVPRHNVDKACRRWRKTPIADPSTARARDLIQRHFGPSVEMDRRYRLRIHRVVASPSRRRLHRCGAAVASICVNPGFPKLPSCSEAFDLGHDHRDIGQLDFSSNLG
jgi:hypothetical protein